MRRRFRVAISPVEPDEDRVTAGSKADRRNDPLHSARSYVVAVVVSMIAAIGAGAATVESSGASGAASSAQKAAAVAQGAAAVAQSTAAGTSSITHQLAVLTARLSTDEQQSCLIEARALPAGHQLARAIGDLGRLLGYLPAARRRESSTQRAARRLLIDMRGHANAYARIERQQPSTRSC